MVKTNKLLNKLLTRPSDFSWNELIKLLSSFGFEEEKTGKTAGSRRKFSRGNLFLFIHKPHPDHSLKKYQVNYVIEVLKQGGIL